MFPGQPVFPPERVTGTPVEIDQFYATISGDPAYELVNEEAGTAFGVFTRCLAAALQGDGPDALTPRGGRAVRRRGPSLTRHPDRPGARGVGHRGRPGADTRLHLPGPTGDRTRCRGSRGARGDREQKGLSTDRSPSSRPTAQDRTARAAEAALARRFGEGAEPGERHLDTLDLRAQETRVVVDGGAVVRALGIRVVHRGIGGELSVRTNGPAATLLQISRPEGDCWAATLLNPPTRQGIVVGRDGVEHLRLGAGRREAPICGRSPEAPYSPPRCGSVVPEVLGQGLVRELLGRRDLTVSLLATYAFQRQGDDRAVAEIVEQFADGSGPIPYDLALLAGRVEELADRLIPAFPLMTRGWSLAGLPIGFRQLLLPVPWTTFSGEVADDVLAPLVLPFTRGGWQ